MKLLKQRFEGVLLTVLVAGNSLEIRKMMEWFPIVAFTFKILVLGTGMFFAIKWHYDKGKMEKAKKEKEKANETGAP